MQLRWTRHAGMVGRMRAKVNQPIESPGLHGTNHQNAVRASRPTTIVGAQVVVGSSARRLLLPRSGGTPTPRIAVLLRVQSALSTAFRASLPQLHLTENRDVAQAIIPEPVG